MKISVFKILFLAILSGCSISNDTIEDYNWKYREGYYIGDWIEFQSVYSLKNDTIFINDSATALITKSYKRIDGSEVMEIQSITANETGTYFAK